MSKFTEVRLTLAAFIYGIEIDLKNIIKQKICPFFESLNFIKDEELERRVVERFKKENPGVSINENIEDIIDFLDFQDTFLIIKKNPEFFDKRIIDYLISIFSELETITPVRNRVMHTRPLLGGDFMTIYDFILKLKINDPIPWLISVETRNKIEKDPSYVLTISIPNSVDDENDIIHNLPIPDFDETGFIGRKKDIDDVKRLILSNKVVSIIGDGGIGKTALALKVVYDILDMKEKCPFELIIWTSAKTTMLTAKGIEDIHTTIKDYTGLLTTIEDSLFKKNENSNERQQTSILEYFDIFKTLLIIDNLETIQSEEVKLFIREAQMRCNIVITSRIGLGELEFPRKLTGLSESESAVLIREVAKIRNSDTLIKLNQATLVDIASKLYFNPLALKWFVNTVQTGISPNEVLSNKNDLLNFCLTNVYEKLSEGAINVLKIIRGARRNLNTAEIIFLSELTPIEVRKNINELFTTTLISRELSGQKELEEITYKITDFAKDFLSKNHPISLDEVKVITTKLKKLSENFTHIKQLNQHNEFGINAISIRTSNEKIAAKFLTEALSFSKRGDFSNALNKIQEAIGIVPNYFECYRISAFIKATAGDVLGAEEDYVTGLEIEPTNVRLLYYYSQFLVFKLEDYDKAKVYINKLHTLRPNHSYTNLLLSRYHSVIHDYSYSIEIIEKLLETELSAKDTIVTYTDLLSLYAKQAFNKWKVENDVHGSIIAYHKSFEVFEKCDFLNILDFKMIKNFSEILLQFMSVLSTVYISENTSRIKFLIETYKSQLALTTNSPKIIAKFNEKFESNYFEQFEQEFQDTERFKGNLSIQSELSGRPFIFILYEQGRIYANKIDFIDVATWIDWSNLKNGQLVSFVIGENHEGICAKEIKIIT